MSEQVLLHCRVCKAITLPLGVRAFVKLSNQFIAAHKHGTDGTRAKNVYLGPLEEKVTEEKKKEEKPPKPISTSVLVNAGLLFDELKFVNGVAEKSSTLPILATVLVTTEPGSLTITATDLDVFNRSTISSSAGKKKMLVCVPAVPLANVLKNMIAEYGRDADVVLEHESPTPSNNKFVVSCGNGKSTVKLNAAWAEDFPTRPDISSAPTLVRMGLAEFQSMTRDVLICATQEVTRFQLHAALAVFDRKRIEMVATDGHRLAIRGGASLVDQRKKWKQLISADTLKQVLRLDGTEISLALVKSKTDSETVTHTVFTSGPREIVGRTMADAKFPDYREVVAKDLACETIVEKSALLRALNRAESTANTRSKPVRLSMKPSSLTLSTNDPDKGETIEELPAKYTGAPMFVGMCITYLRQCATALPSAVVQIKTKDKDGQIQLRAVGEGLSEQLLYVVMPMRLQ